MRNMIVFRVVLIAAGCQRTKDLAPKAFQLLEGKWERTAYRINQNEWMADSTNGNSSLIFRADGVPLNGDGFGFCCPPQKFLINGNLTGMVRLVLVR